MGKRYNYYKRCASIMNLKKLAVYSALLHISTVVFKKLATVLFILASMMLRR